MPAKNETGNRYGRLTVIKRVENNHRADAQWLCLCDCGNEIITTGVSLRSGHTQSCGCKQIDHVRELGFSNTADLIGKRFGSLVVAERIEDKWRCECDCGGYTLTSTNKLKSGHTMSCGCLKSKGELAIGLYLKDRNINFQREFRFDQLKSAKNYALRFDFAIFKNSCLSCLVEFDGIQHFDLNHPFYTENLTLNDNLKNEFCFNNNINLYRIKYNQNLEEELDKILEKEELL